MPNSIFRKSMSLASHKNDYKKLIYLAEMLFTQKKCVIRPLQMLVDVAKLKEKSSSERLTLRDYGTNTAQIFKH